MRSVYFLLFCLVAFSVGLYGQEVPKEELTVEDIIAMVQAGISDRLILQKISISTLLYEPNVRDILELRKAGVSERIIRALMGVPGERVGFYSLTPSGIDRGAYPRFELFAGFGYARVLDVDANLFGWDLAFEGNLNEWFSIAGDISGGYGDVFGIGVNAHTFSVGPQFSVRSGSGRGFFRVLVGGTRSSALGFSSTEFSLLAGGGIDLGISERIAFRVFQVDYLRVRIDQGSNNFRIAGGPVFRF